MLRIGRGFRLYAEVSSRTIMNTGTKQGSSHEAHACALMSARYRRRRGRVSRFGFDGFGLGTAAILLVCPLMMFGTMFFMMRGTHGVNDHEHKDTNDRDRQTAAH